MLHVEVAVAVPGLVRVACSGIGSEAVLVWD